MITIRRFLTTGSSTKAAAAGTSTVVSSTMHSPSIPYNPFAAVPLAPADQILGITEQFIADKRSEKVNLGVGIYKNNKGDPYILSSVALARSRLAEQEIDMSYLPIMGHNKFRQTVRQFLFGHFAAGVELLKQERVLTLQTLSGTGSLHVLAQFLGQFTPRKVYMPQQTWANHKGIFQNAGFSVETYSYYDTKLNDLNFEQLYRDLQAAEIGSYVLLHAVCHNPTGMDPTREQWRKIFEVVRDRKLLPIVDMAYQGFKTGSVFEDTFVYAQLTEMTLRGEIDGMFLCQSFAKNMGLYGERIGSLSFVLQDQDTVARVESQLKKIIRINYSSPPLQGALIANEVLSDTELFKQWIVDVESAALRIISIRERLHARLHWEHLIKQSGMFCYTGLTQKQITDLKNNHAIYATLDGRISLAGVNDTNIDYIADCFEKVTQV